LCESHFLWWYTMICHCIFQGCICCIKRAGSNLRNWKCKSSSLYWYNHNYIYLYFFQLIFWKWIKITFELVIVYTVHYKYYFKISNRLISFKNSFELSLWFKGCELSRKNQREFCQVLLKNHFKVDHVSKINDETFSKKTSASMIMRIIHFWSSFILIFSS